MLCRTTAECTGQTGVKMGALTPCSVALLTIYDMCKALDRGMTISGVRLMEKSGGKSGRFVASVLQTQCPWFCTLKTVYRNKPHRLHIFLIDQNSPSG